MRTGPATLSMAVIEYGSSLSSTVIDACPWLAVYCGGFTLATPVVLDRVLARAETSASSSGAEVLETT